MRLHECNRTDPKIAASTSLISTYDPKYDVTYLEQSALDNFCKEPYDLLGELDPTEDLAWALKWGKLITMSTLSYA